MDLIMDLMDLDLDHVWARSDTVNPSLVSYNKYSHPSILPPSSPKQRYSFHPTFDLIVLVPRRLPAVALGQGAERIQLLPSQSPQLPHHVVLGLHIQGGLHQGVLMTCSEHSEWSRMVKYTVYGFIAVSLHLSGHTYIAPVIPHTYHTCHASHQSHLPGLSRKDQQ